MSAKLYKKLDLSESSLISKLEPFAYLAPFTLGIAVFTLYPLAYVVLMSFMEDFNDLTRGFSRFGLANYAYVLAHKDFLQGMGNTFFYVAIVVPAATCLSLLAANLLNQKLRLTALFQTMYFLPMVTSVTAVGLAWRFIFNENLGVLNYILSLFGVDKLGWLTKARWNMWALCIYGVWNTMPFTIILLLAGLQNVNPLHYIAARVDGAKPGRIFFRITIPLLAPTIGLTTIVNTISSFKVFNELFPLFKGEPGPFNNLYTVVFYIYYQMTNKHKLGRAAAAAMVLFSVIFVFTMLQLFIQRKWKHY